METTVRLHNQQKNMQRRLKSVLLLMLAVYVMIPTFTSCKKEVEYSGRVVFWQTQSNATELRSIGITSLKMYLGGQLVGSQDASIYFNASPDCGAQGAVTARYNLGNKTSQVVAYRVLDQDNDVVYDGTLEIKNNVCLAFQLD